MVKLSANSRIVRWSYWRLFSRTPSRTTLCRLFWRAVLVTPLQGVLVVVSAPFWVPVWVYCSYLQEHVDAWLRARMEAQWRRDRERYDRKRQTSQSADEPSAWRVLWEGAKSVKSKVCPLVEIVKPAKQGGS